MKYNSNEKTMKPLFGMVFLIVAVTALLFGSFVLSLSKFSDEDDVDDTDASQQTNSEVSKQDSAVESSSGQEPSTESGYKYYNDIAFEQCAFGNDLVYSGDLAVITGENGKYQVIPDDDPLVSIYGKKTGSYGLSGTSLKLRETAMANFDRFIMSFYSVFPRNGLGVDKAYVSPESLSQGARADLASGNSVVFEVYGSGGSLSNKDFSYLKEQAFRYGIIQRYPEGKEVNTGIEANSAIYRYVGVAHSCYMNHYNLCLEEYIDKLRTEKVIEYDNEYEDDASYVMYYVNKNVSNDVTYVPLPSGGSYEYSVSGDGSDGFIVTIKIA